MTTCARGPELKEGDGGLKQMSDRRHFLKMKDKSVALMRTFVEFY